MNGLSTLPASIRMRTAYPPAAARRTVRTSDSACAIEASMKWNNAHGPAWALFTVPRPPSKRIATRPGPSPGHATLKLFEGPRENS